MYKQVHEKRGLLFATPMRCIGTWYVNSVQHKRLAAGWSKEHNINMGINANTWSTVRLMNLMLALNNFTRPKGVVGYNHATSCQQGTAHKMLVEWHISHLRSIHVHKVKAYILFLEQILNECHHITQNYRYLETKLLWIVQSSSNGNHSLKRGKETKH